jgi:DNA-directed RNA polymerase I, II, and III subunit RPABC4
MDYQPGARGPQQQIRLEVTYICGGFFLSLLTPTSECGVDNVIKPKEPIRCQECGYRIMYKKRTKRSILQFIT